MEKKNWIWRCFNGIVCRDNHDIE